MMTSAGGDSGEGPDMPDDGRRGWWRVFMAMADRVAAGETVDSILADYDLSPAPQSGGKDADALLRAGVNLIADHFGRRGQYPNREPYDRWMVRLRDWQEQADAYLGQSKTGEGGE